MNNIKKIRQKLQESEFDALLITSPANRFYATGFQSSAGMLLLTKNDAWFYTDSRYMEAASLAVTDAFVVAVTVESPYHKQIKDRLSGYGIASIGFEDKSVTYSQYLDLAEKLGIELISAGKLLDELRMVKSAKELSKMVEAQRIAEKSFNEILPLISTDITEKELAAELVYRFIMNGADDKSFDTIVLSGKNSSRPHGVPGNDKLSKGFLTIDFGAKFEGWCSDTTRTLCIGKPDEEMKRVYDTVLSAQQAGIEAVRAGVAGHDVDAAARAKIIEAGYGEYFGHGFGHGLGHEVHEPPLAAKSSKDILHKGTLISAEPGIYLPGRYGVRIEDVVQVTESGCENITKLTKELIVL